VTRQKKEYYMGLALAVSRQALPVCRPNPPVGCVLVRDGLVVAEGFTQEPGKDHAEAMALRHFTGSLALVDVFVTLEPCSFVGRTPACALALVERGASRVYVGLVDPHPKNRGTGIRLLQDAGVEVETGVLGEEVSQFLAPYLIRH
jgi:pyrimidine deaminase RibD-like protein